MQTETITWRQLADGMPDAETNVLLTLAGEEPGTCEGFLDGEWETGSHKGQPLFRDVTARALPAGEVTHWADMPRGAAGVASVAPTHWCPSTARQCEQGCGDECQRLAPAGVPASLPCCPPGEPHAFDCPNGVALGEGDKR